MPILEIMLPILAVAIGSAIGALLRFWLGALVTKRFPSQLPLGTLTVNTSGCFLIGVMAALFNLDNPHLFTIFLSHGMLGGFTTISTFSFQTLTLLQQKRLPLAAVNVLLSIVTCLSATWYGWSLYR